MKTKFLVTALLLISMAHAQGLKFDPAGANQPLKIDFSSSELGKVSLDSIKKVASDHATRIKAQVTGVSGALHPVLEDDNYSYYFTFHARSNESTAATLSCYAVTNKTLTLYSAACFNVK